MKLSELNKLLNSELTTKIKKTHIENNELSINVKIENILFFYFLKQTNDVDLNN